MIRSVALAIVMVLITGMISSQAQEGSIKDISSDKISIGVSPAKVAAGTQTKITMIFPSTNQTISVKQIDIIPPWEDPLGIDNTITIRPYADEMISTNLGVPPIAPEGKYTIVFKITDSYGKVTLVSKEIEVGKFTPLEDQLNPILALLVAYVIPAQIIERILDMVRKNNRTKKDDDEEKYSLDAMTSMPKISGGKDGGRKSQLDTLYEKIQVLTEELNWWKKARDTYRDATLEAHKTHTLNGEEIKILAGEYEKIGLIDKKISKISIKLSKAEKNQAYVIWGYATLMAIAPAVLFSFLGLGLIQMILRDGQIVSLLGDIVINTLFIGSGTKPLHDIIKLLKRN